MDPSRAFLADLYRTAVAAAHPASCLVPYLPEAPPTGRLVILAAGKAAGAMAEVAEAHYLDRIPPARIAGVAVTRRGYGRPTRIVEVIEAGHPVPAAASLAGAERALALAAGATAGDLVLVLMSGGASANWIAPVAELTLAEKQAVNRALLKSGAGIGDVNTVRKHLSRIKGGRLARRAHPAAVTTLAISDVPGDDPAVIGSGPTVPVPAPSPMRGLWWRDSSSPWPSRCAKPSPIPRTNRRNRRIPYSPALRFASSPGPPTPSAPPRPPCGPRVTQRDMNASSWAIVSRARPARLRPPMAVWCEASRPRGGGRWCCRAAN